MIDSVILYIESNFGVKIIQQEFQDMHNLPLYLSKGYEYTIIQFLDKSFMLAHKTNFDNLNINSINIHVSKIKNALNLDYPIILVFDHLNTYLRKQLINERISFIIPGKMIFIFELGAVFHERQRSNYTIVKDSPLDKMAPSTQALFLYIITTDNFDFTMNDIAKNLDITKMSVSRGFNELHRLGIIEKNEYLDRGMYRFEKSKKEVWALAQKYMIDPVFKIFNVHQETVESRRHLFIVSGESALSKFSMITPPSNRVYGITKKYFRKINLNDDELNIYDDNPAVIQVFKHTLPSNDGVLHPLSIALVLKDENDPRVRNEIEIMLDKYFN